MEPTAAGRPMTPLEGVRVLDLSRVLAGPYATMLLADLGADVIKVERVDGGDETRGWGPPFQGGEASYFLSVNRGKRSCALDLGSDADRELLLRLSEGADVFVENFRVGGADKLGVGFEAIRSRRPDIVYCSVTGFGSGREPTDRPGYDFLAQAESGLMSITGLEDPVKVGVAIVDVVAGLHLTSAILAALRGRDRNGEAQRIEVSLLDAGVSSLVNVAANALATGEEPRRWGNAHPNIVPYQTFRAEDGWLVVAVGNDRAFGALCRTLGLERLSSDDRFATNSKRVANREALVSILADRIAERPAGFWVERLDAAGVPAGQIRGVLDAIRAGEAAGESMTFRLPHPRAGDLDQVKPPFNFNGHRPTATAPPPLLGQHTEQIRRDGWGRGSDR
jgi:crotonobetainyl-CoA:carnitine CoA-transferase CaiB-like acyl-CoA transferase